MAIDVVAPAARASARYVRSSATKARAVLDLIRGESCERADEILQFSERVLILYEYVHATRTVYMDGTPHPEGHIDFWMGDSRGHWAVSYTHLTLPTIYSV